MRAEDGKRPSRKDIQRRERWPSRQVVILTPGIPSPIEPILNRERTEALFEEEEDFLGESHAELLDVVDIGIKGSSIEGKVFFLGFPPEKPSHTHPLVDRLVYPSGRRTPVIIKVRLDHLPEGLEEEQEEKLAVLLRNQSGEILGRTSWEFFEKDVVGGWPAYLVSEAWADDRNPKPFHNIFYEEDLPKVRYEVQLRADMHPSKDQLPLEGF